MISVHAKWKEGRVVVDEAVDWPEGCELEVRPVQGIAVEALIREIYASPPDVVKLAAQVEKS